jgi:hypothetical protein
MVCLWFDTLSAGHVLQIVKLRIMVSRANGGKLASNLHKWFKDTLPTKLDRRVLEEGEGRTLSRVDTSFDAAKAGMSA